MKSPIKAKVKKVVKSDLKTDQPLAEKDEVKAAEEKQRKKAGNTKKQLE